MSISPPPRIKRPRLVEGHNEPLSTYNDELVIYSWNVNGIDALLQSSIQDYWSPPKRLPATQDRPPSSPIRQFLQRHAWPTLCFLQEVKIRPGDESKMRAIRRTVSNIANQDEPDYEAHFCLPSKDRYTTKAGNRKVYGVCSLVRRDYAQGNVDRVRSVAWDSEGRFSIVETKTKGSIPKLAIFNVYLVNGTDLPYRNADTGEIVGTRHDRKLEVHKLLQAECRALEQQGFSVIIAGDINIARSSLDGHPRLRIHPYQHVVNRADFERRFFGSSSTLTALAPGNKRPRGGVYKTEEEGDDLRKRPHDEDTDEQHGQDDDKPSQMLDTFRYLHPDTRGYSYYSHSVDFGESCDRVDSIIVSPSLIKSCCGAGMHETPAERGSSDHVPIFARFSFEQPP